MASREVHLKRFVGLRVQVTTVSLTMVAGEQLDIIDTDADPYNVLQRKIATVAEALNCTEEEAERLILSRA